MTMLLFGGVIGLLLGLLLFGVWMTSRNRFTRYSETNANWIRIPWKFGGILFLFNAFLFGLVLFLFFANSISAGFHIPLILVVFLAPLASLLGWTWLAKVFQGSKQDRFKAALFGSSPYWILAIIASIRYVTLKPQFPGDDLFMAYLGLDIFVAVCILACLFCFAAIMFLRGKPLI